MTTITQTKAAIKAHKETFKLVPTADRPYWRQVLKGLNEDLRQLRQERAERIQAKKQAQIERAEQRQQKARERQLVEQRIIDTIGAQGSRGAVSSQIENITGLHANTISARLTNLRDDGDIVTDETLRKSEAHPKGEYVYWLPNTKPEHVQQFHRDTVSAKALLSERNDINLILASDESSESKLFRISLITKYQGEYF